MGILPFEPDSEAEFSALTHEDHYGGGYSSVVQLSEAPYMLSIQPSSPDQSINPPPSSVLSPQPMRYPQLVPLLSISIPGGDEVPALESASSSPESPPSQSTPLLGNQQGMYHNFVTDEFGYNRYAIIYPHSVPFISDHPYLQIHSVPRILHSSFNSVSTIRSDPPGTADGLLL